MGPMGIMKRKICPSLLIYREMVDACFNALLCGLVRKGATWPVSECVLNGSPVCHEVTEPGKTYKESVTRYNSPFEGIMG